MEPYTLDRNFLKKHIIDGFNSILWTERYYGDGDCKLVVPATDEFITKLPEGIFLSVNDTDEVMILETREFDGKGSMTLTGISLLKWMNERFVRTSPYSEDRYWYLTGITPGDVLRTIIELMCMSGSPYLDGTANTGVLNPEALVIPGLEVDEYDDTGETITVGVPYGPVYDAMKDIASTYEIGQQILLTQADEDSYTLGYRNYRGIDRTALQDINPVVRFAPQMDSLTDVKDIQSVADLKTLVYAFAPSNPDGLAILPGVSILTGDYSGFDLRAAMIFAEDVTTDQVDGDPAALVDVLNSRAEAELTNHPWHKAVDGEIVPDNIYKYGRDYFLGDLVEVEGNTKVIQTARVMEYIRSHDATGEKTYPTLTTIDTGRLGPRPNNDPIEGAYTLGSPDGGSYAGINTYATTQFGEASNWPSEHNGAGKTVWYKITPDEDIIFSWHVVGIGFYPLDVSDASMVVYRDGGTLEIPPDFDDLDVITDRYGGTEHTLRMEEGYTYYISIDVIENGTPGSFNLIYQVESAQSIDNIVDARELIPGAIGVWKKAHGDNSDDYTAYTNDTPNDPTIAAFSVAPGVDPGQNFRSAWFKIPLNGWNTIQLAVSMYMHGGLISVDPFGSVPPAPTYFKEILAQADIISDTGDGPYSLDGEISAADFTGGSGYAYISVSSFETYGTEFTLEYRRLT